MFSHPPPLHHLHHLHAPAQALANNFRFVLDKVAKQLAADSAEQEADDPEPYVELHPEYPARRRAQRLSYSVWLVIREEGLELQPLLETASTSDRLRMALIRLRELAERLPPAGETK